MNLTAQLMFDDGWWTAQCVEIPGANGQGETEDEALASLREAVQLLSEDNYEQLENKNLESLNKASKAQRFVLS